MYKAADVCNQALIAIGSDMLIGDLEEGSRESRVLVNLYAPTLRKLLRSAHWDFARAQEPLLLLADATGQTASMPTMVQRPWNYAYAYPDDCLMARFVPMTLQPPGAGFPAGNTSIPPGIPMTTGGNNTGLQNARLIPARFLIGSDPNFPPMPGQEWFVTQGVSPTARTVVMTNVVHAHLVYTRFQPYANLWDASFRDAFVALLASEAAMVLAPERKLAVQIRNAQIAIAKDKIMAARVSDGNEGHYTTNREASWMRARNLGTVWTGLGGFGFGESGILGIGYDSCSFADGSSF